MAVAALAGLIGFMIMSWMVAGAPLLGPLLGAASELMVSVLSWLGASVELATIMGTLVGGFITGGVTNVAIGAFADWLSRALVHPGSHRDPNAWKGDFIIGGAVGALAEGAGGLWKLWRAPANGLQAGAGLAKLTDFSEGGAGAGVTPPAEPKPWSPPGDTAVPARLSFDGGGFP